LCGEWCAARAAEKHTTIRDQQHAEIERQNIRAASVHRAYQ
jgi:hypothetical protein